MRTIIKEINREIKIKDNLNTYEGSLTAWIYSDEKTQIKVEILAKTFFSLERSNLFDCLIDIRNSFSSLNWLLLCNGSRYDVYPSGLRKQMGKGLFAYQMKLGEAVSASDLVDIFQECDEEKIASPEVQKEYFEHWFNSP